jgi:hypothetical protein
MNDQKRREKAFSEDIDRLVAGQSPGGDFSGDREYQNALEFAHGMAIASPEISPGFRAALKARLLARAEAPTPERSWMRDFTGLLRQPVWQAVTAVLVLACAGLLVWASVGQIHRSTGIAPGTVLAAAGKTDKTSYSHGEPVKISVELRNVSGKDYSIAQFPPILSIMDSSDNRPVYTFKAGRDKVVLPPGQTTTCVFLWDQSDASGAPATPGNYYVELEDVDTQGSPVQLRLAGPVSFDIRSY